MRPEPLPLITHKCDEANATKLIERGYPAVAPVLPYMIEWLQDCNWPVAKPVFGFLASIGAPVLPEIRRVFATHDDVWKYWCIELLKAMPLAVAEQMRSDLAAIVNEPTPGEISEEVVEGANELLAALNVQRG